MLGARAWRAVAIDFAQGIVRVEAIASSKLARWQSRGGLLGRDLCQAMLEIVSDDAPPEWSRRARDQLAALRTEYRDAGAGSSAIVSDTYGLRLWTFGGGKANSLLAGCLEERFGEKLIVDNLYAAFRGQAATSEIAIREAIAELRRDGRPDDADALRLAESCARGRLSKFQHCLPPRLESAFLAEVLTDPAAARLAIWEPAIDEGLKRWAFQRRFRFISQHAGAALAHARGTDANYVRNCDDWFVHRGKAPFPGPRVGQPIG